MFVDTDLHDVVISLQDPEHAHRRRQAGVHGRTGRVTQGGEQRGRVCVVERLHALFHANRTTYRLDLGLLGADEFGVFPIRARRQWEELVVSGIEDQ